MPKTRSYVENLTKRDEGRQVEDPSGEEWIIRGVAKRTERGRRRWFVGLQHADERRRYKEIEMETILNRSWTWADDDEPVRVPSSSGEVPRDDEGRRLCRRCNEPIFFIEMQGSGKKMPVDHAPIAARDALEKMDAPAFDKPTGLVARAGKVLSARELKQAAEADMTVYRSHFVSCTEHDG